MIDARPPAVYCLAPDKPPAIQRDEKRAGIRAIAYNPGHPQRRWADGTTRKQTDTTQNQTHELFGHTHTLNKFTVRWQSARTIVILVSLQVSITSWLPRIQQQIVPVGLMTIITD